MVINNHPSSSSSSGGDGTLSGQTSQSDSFTVTSSESVNAFVAQVSDSNVRDDDSDDLTDDDDKDTCDYGDDNESSKGAVTYMTTELPSDSSSGLKQKPKRTKRSAPDDSSRNGREKTNDGDTGSSSSISTLPISNNQRSNPSITAGKPAIDELSLLVDDLRRQLSEEHRSALQETKRTIIYEAQNKIEQARAEEAWTAQQHLIQIQASTDIEAEANRVKLRNIELQANAVIEHEARKAAQERIKTSEVISEARAEFEVRTNKEKQQEHELQMLRNELHKSKAYAEEERHKL